MGGYYDPLLHFKVKYKRGISIFYWEFKKGQTVLKK